MIIKSVAPSRKQLRYWNSLKGKPPVGIDNHGKEPWNKNTKGLIKANSGSFVKGERRSPETEFKRLNKTLSYQGVHSWIRRKYGKANLCEECGSSFNIDWANLSGKYLEDRNDWKQLCGKCHFRFDNVSQKIWDSRRRKEVA